MTPGRTNAAAGVGQRRGLACHLVEGHADELGEGASERGNRPVHLVADGVTAPGRGVLDDAAEVEPGDSAVDEPSRQRSEEGGQLSPMTPLASTGLTPHALTRTRRRLSREARGRTRRDDPDTLERRAIVHRSAHGGVRSEAARPRPKTLTRRRFDYSSESGRRKNWKCCFLRKDDERKRGARGMSESSASLAMLAFSDENE